MFTLYSASTARNKVSLSVSTDDESLGMDEFIQSIEKQNIRSNNHRLSNRSQRAKEINVFDQIHKHQQRKRIATDERTNDRSIYSQRTQQYVRVFRGGEITLNSFTRCFFSFFYSSIAFIRSNQNISLLAPTNGKRAKNLWNISNAQRSPRIILNSFIQWRCWQMRRCLSKVTIKSARKKLTHYLVNFSGAWTTKG